MLSPSLLLPQEMGIPADEQPPASPQVPPPSAAAALAEQEDEDLRRAIEASMDRSQDVVPSQVRQDAAWAAAAASGGGTSSGAAGAAVPDGIGGFTALRNEAGEYNCFLNVLVQCLWHCREFRQQVGGRREQGRNGVWCSRSKCGWE